MSRLINGPKRVQGLVAQRTNRINVNPYFIPFNINKEEHYQLAQG